MTGRRLLAMALGLAVLAAAAALLVRGEPDALGRARRVRAWPGPPPAYAWVSDREVLRFVEIPRAPGTMLVRENVDTGAHTPLQAASQAILQAGLPARSFAGRLYPGGRWLVIERFGLPGLPAPGSPPRVYLIACATGRPVRIPRLFDAAAFDVLADGRRWVCFVQENVRNRLVYVARIYRTDGAAAVLEREVPVRAQGKRLPLGIFAIIGTTPDDHALVYAQEWGQKTPYELYDVDLRASTPVARQLPVPVMGSGAAGYVASVSPDGRRVVVATACWRAGPALANRIRAWLGAPPARTDRLDFWVCNLDGTGKRSLGSTPVWRELPDGLTWTPDGKHVSFVMRRALWELPVD